MDLDPARREYKAAPMLEVWGRRNSLNVQKVSWLVGELDIPHAHTSVGGPFGGLSDPGFAALNPNRLIPVVRDDGWVVWESHAILRYLAARFGGEGWWPKGPGERSAFDRWMDWCLAHWQPAFSSGVFWGMYRTPEAERDWPGINRSIALCTELLGIVEDVLAERPFLAGDRFTIGDIPLGASLYRYFALDIARPALPNVEAWYGRLAARPAYREHVMVPFDALKGRRAF